MKHPAQRERGAAVAEFAMVTGLVLFLFLGVMQLGLALHVRNTLTLAASEGARAGARLDAGPSVGVRRAREVVTGSLSAQFAEHISAHHDTVDGVRVVVVTIHAPIPVLGPIGPDRTLTVTGRAFEEAQ
ncbi:MAG TPA: pilus assembly protein [Intrasporangiaceae bacterium]|nr:pilus assembly protein [Intrasporangiaceae bacterium]